MKGRYIRDFNRLNAVSADVLQIDDAMLEIYPESRQFRLAVGVANNAKKQA